MWTFATAIFLLFAIIYFYYKHAYLHWARKNVPHIKPTIPFGNFGNLIFQTKPIYAQFRDYYRTMKDLGCKHTGFYVFTLPVYMPINREYIKNVLVKDFQNFTNHGLYCNQVNDPLSAHLFTLEDKAWKDLRSKLTPTFTSSKMKMMFTFVKDCSIPLIEEIGKRKEDFDVKDLMQKYLLDLISSCGFGIESNTFKDPGSEFVHYGKTAALDYVMRPKLYLLQFWPNLSKKLGLRIIRKEVSKFFMDLVNTTVKYREEQGVVRNDFLQILIGLRSNGLLTLEELSAQVYMFFFAGFDSTALAMTYALFELAIHGNIQEKVREEVEAVLKRYDGDLSYEAIQEMKYLQQVIDETCRKDSPVTFLFRKCCKDYNIPNTDITIEKHTMVLIPTYALHYDDEYFPQPEKFDPERFSEENKKKIPQFTYLPFGDGPRSCIGIRFAMMMMKVGLVQILRSYRIRLGKNSRPELIMKIFDIGYTNENTIYLDAVKI